jgi:hypothetical protein
MAAQAAQAAYVASQRQHQQRLHYASSQAQAEQIQQLTHMMGPYVHQQQPTLPPDDPNAFRFEPQPSTSQAQLMSMPQSQRDLYAMQQHIAMNPSQGQPSSAVNGTYPAGLGRPPSQQAHRLRAAPPSARSPAPAPRPAQAGQHPGPYPVLTPHQQQQQYYQQQQQAAMQASMAQAGQGMIAPGGGPYIPQPSSQGRAPPARASTMPQQTRPTPMRTPSANQLASPAEQAAQLQAQQAAAHAQAQRQAANAQAQAQAAAVAARAVPAFSYVRQVSVLPRI